MYHANHLKSDFYCNFFFIGTWEKPKLSLMLNHEACLFIEVGIPLYDFAYQGTKDSCICAINHKIPWFFDAGEKHDK
jgi:hypothetical protein